MPTNICQETKDYENCRSYRFMTACGFPYDYGSVMHYTAKRSESSKYVIKPNIFLDSFAIDDTKNVMTATDPSVTTLGNNYGLSELDKKKLQCLY